MNKKNSVQLKVSYLFCLVYLLFNSVLAFASDPQSNKSTSNISNIGFIKNPSNELVDKFPMCDEFLKVEWIDRENRIGYSHFEPYLKRVKQKAVTAFIVMSDFRHGFNFSEYVEKHHNQSPEPPTRQSVKDNLEGLISYIKNGKIEFHDASRTFSVTYSDTTISFAVPLDAGFRTLSNHNANICIPYPDKRRMWVAELSLFENLYSKEVIEKKFNKIKPFNVTSQFPPLPLNINMFKSYFPLDINYDGVEDYYGDASTIYFYDGEYYRMEPMWTHERDDEYGWYGIPPTNRICKISHWKTWKLPLITDGRNYYLANQCNLTELLSNRVQE